MDPDLLATVDHVAIARLQDAYAESVSRRDWVAVQALFLPGAVVELDLVDRPHRSLEGSHEVAAFLDDAVGRFSFFEFVILNRHIELWPGGDRSAANGRISLCELRLPHGASAREESFGRYRDRYAKVDGAWRIAGRRYRSLARFPAATVFPPED